MFYDESYYIASSLTWDVFHFERGLQDVVGFGVHAEGEGRSVAPGRIVGVISHKLNKPRARLPFPHHRAIFP